MTPGTGEVRWGGDEDFGGPAKLAGTDSISGVENPGQITKSIILDTYLLRKQF